MQLTPAQQQRPYKGVFEHMAFPPYRFEEYPKQITVNGKDIIVQSQREELALIATTPEAMEKDPVVVEKNKLASMLSDELMVRQKLELELAELRAKVVAMEKPLETVSVTIPEAKVSPAPATATTVEVKPATPVTPTPVPPKPDAKVRV